MGSVDNETASRKSVIQCGINERQKEGGDALQKNVREILLIDFDFLNTGENV